MTSEPPAIVFVIDDDVRLRDDLVDYLVQEGYTALGFASYEQFVPAAQLLQPSVVVLDLGLPGLDGLQVCPLLRERWPQIGVVMLTSRSTVEQQEAGMHAGADAYLSKTASLALVKATLASVLRRLKPVSPQGNPAAPGQISAWSFVPEQLKIVSPLGREAVLSSNEFSLMQTLMQANGHSVTREALLSLTGKADTPINRRNLDATISRIRAKVRHGMDIDLPVRSVYANGYAFGPTRASDSPV